MAKRVRAGERQGPGNGSMLSGVREALPDGVRETLPGVRDRVQGAEAARRAARERLDRVVPLAAYPTTPGAAQKADSDYGTPATPTWRSIDWSRHTRDVRVEGRAVRYVDLGTGDGPPVVFVHGLGGNWQNWLENVPAVAERRRVLALDLPGFGESSMPREEISISGYARIVDAWLEGLGVGPVAVVGNSMGGFIGAELAIRFSERVDRLTLAAAAGISITSLRRRPTLTAARVSAAVGALAASRSHEVIARPRLRHLVLSTVVRHPSRLPADLLFEIMRGSGKPGFMDALEALLSYDFRDRLGEIRCPTLIVWGRNDVLVPVKDADEFERRVPQSRQVVMDDTGHVPMLERSQAFNRLLLEFLGEPGAGDSA